jgi:hypothetical protein
MTLTLGDLVYHWLRQHLPSPRDEHARIEFAPWQRRRVQRWYEIEPDGARCWNRCHDEDPKGKGKSPLAAAIDVVEFRGPVVFDRFAKGGEVYDCLDHGCSCGWGYEFEPGEPMGTTWGSPGLPAPWVQVLGVSERQTANTWAPLDYFLSANRSRLAGWLDLDAGRTLVYWRARDDAKIEMVTSSAGSRTGQPITHATMDEPQEWTPALRGPELARTVLANLTKTGGWAHITGNAPVLGTGSVSEMLGYRFDDERRTWVPVDTPRVLQIRPRPAVTPREDMTRDELRPLIEEVYEGAPWVPMARILDDATDRAAYPWADIMRLFLNVPTDDTSAAAWMAPEAWDACAGTPAFTSREPAFACVRIAHRHQWAAVAVAQRGPHPDDRSRSMIHLEVRLFHAEEGDQVDVTSIEAHLHELRRRFPARVKATERVGNRQRERTTSLRGPEIAYAGAFFEGSAQRFRAERAALVDIPSSPARLKPAAETLMQLVQRGELVHDGDPDLAEQMGDVIATPAPEGWKPEPRNEDVPIVAAIAAMLAVHRAQSAPRWKPSPVRGL